MSFTSVQIGTRFPFQPIPDQDFSLDSHKIDIWQYSLETLYPHAEALLSVEELQRAKRFHFARHQRRFTMARAGMRLILARYLKEPAKELKFLTNEYGKPYLNHAIPIQFNLSHSQDLAILAIGQNHPLGIDVEFFSGRPFTGMSNIMFSISENQQYAQIPKTMRTLAFFHVWAQKEAFIKACGMGLSYPTQSFDVPVLSALNTDVIDKKHALTWHMRSFMPKIACFAALCHHPSIQTIRYKVWDIDHAFG